MRSRTKLAIGTIVGAITVVWALYAVPSETHGSLARARPTTTGVSEVQPEWHRPLLVHAEPEAASPAPPCDVSEIAAEFSREGHAVGHDWLEFRLLNVGSENCQLSGDPLVTAQLAGSDPVIASRGLIVAGWPEAGPAATVPPGDSANLSVILNAECQRQRPSAVPPNLPAATVRLGLPGGSIELAMPDTVKEDFRPNGVCSFAVSGFERFYPVAR